MERGLVGAEVHSDVFRSQSFPEVNHIALIGEGDGLLVPAGLADSRDELVKVIVKFVHPALVITLAGCERIDFGDHAHHSGNDTRLRLCP